MDCFQSTCLGGSCRSVLVPVRIALYLSLLLRSVAFGLDKASILAGRFNVRSICDNGTGDASRRNSYSEYDIPQLVS